MSVTRSDILSGRLAAVMGGARQAGGSEAAPRDGAAEARAFLAAHGLTGDPWVFAYGSLMWNPTFRFAERRPATVSGHARSLCLLSLVGRGTPAAPGVLFGLVPGGGCAGFACRIPRRRAAAELGLLWTQETILDEYRPVLLDAVLDDGRRIAALSFAVNTAHPHFRGDLDDRTLARMIATGEGVFGSTRAYVAGAVAALDRAGLGDDGIERARRLLTAADTIAGDRRTDHRQGLENGKVSSRFPDGNE